MATKPGRKSAADIRVVKLTGARVEAPDHLTDEQRSEWVGIVDSLPADYFRPGDVSLLAAYCVASAFYKEAAKQLQRDGIVLEMDNGRKYAHPAKDILTSQASAMAQMATKLRLAPSSRYTEKSAQTKTASSGVGGKPWEATG